MKILVRLPNWLGDMVMAAGFLNQLPYFFPDAEVSVIAKKGIHDLLDLFRFNGKRFIFNKEEYPGVRGALAFGREIRKQEEFDIFFCLPNSFSAALMGFATGATKRVGYKKEFRQVLLTDAYNRPQGMHRADEYIHLLSSFTGLPPKAPDVTLTHGIGKNAHVVVNINSEASSRRLTVHKAADLIRELRLKISEKIILIGAPKERAFVSGVLDTLGPLEGIENRAGETSLVQLASLLASARLMVSTDSGPAHLANALATHTIVLFGAGDEKRTAPYRPSFRTVIRLGQLSCEPCEKNICVRFGTPQCLERLDTHLIVQTANQRLRDGKKYT